MENKEFPELDPRDIFPDEISTPPEEMTAEEESPVFVDYFADILPVQPMPETDPQPEEEILTEIQSVVETVIAEAIPAEEELTYPEYTQQMSLESDTGPVPQMSDTDSLPLDFEELPPESTPNQELREAFDTEEDFDDAFNAPAEEKPAPVHDRPVRKGRPRRKKGEFLFGIPQIAITCVWLAIILLTGVTLGRMLWVCAADVLAFGREDKMVTVTVYESDTIEDITEKLHKGGLIRYPGLFGIYASLAVDEGEIQPGIWDLNTMYDYHALVNMMSPSSSREVVENVLVPEGYSCRQIFELLEEKRVCTAKDLAAYAASGELNDYWFLTNVERGYEYCLEGFLFPDTYDFYKNSSPRDVLQKMLDNFQYRFNEEMIAQIDSLNANVTGGTFDIHDVVIVASLIEKETASNEESPRFASVIYNRLFNWGGTPAYLNIDASIVYALDGKTDLTAEDLKVESPYNTYTNTGLTPGAIANPGLASLKAALNPEDTDYYFYVLDPAQGKHKFSTTLDEHNAFIASLE